MNDILVLLPLTLSHQGAHVCVGYTCSPAWRQVQYQPVYIWDVFVFVLFCFSFFAISLENNYINKTTTQTFI